MVVLFLTALFSVKDLVVEYSVYGRWSSEDVDGILSAYEGKSLVFVDAEEIKKEISSKTPFIVERVEKEYPSSIRVVLSSRQERYAVERADGGYYILDEIFTVCDEREEIKNSADMLDNILLEFVNIDVGGLAVKTRVDLTENTAFAIVNAFTGEINSPRDHIISVTVEDKGYGNYYLTAVMREGVSIEIRKAGDRIAEKSAAALEKYFALADKDKLSGKVICFEADGGDIIAQYE